MVFDKVKPEVVNCETTKNGYPRFMARELSQSELYITSWISLHDNKIKVWGQMNGLYSKFHQMKQMSKDPTNTKPI
jgi:hypothetical protein